MQSAAGSLRGTRPSSSVRLGTTVAWGVGADGLALAGHYRFRVTKGAVTICGVALSLSASPNGDNVNISDWYEVSAPAAPYPLIAPTHSQFQTDVYTPQELRDFASTIEVEESSFPLNLGKLAPPYRALWPDLSRVEGSGSFVHIPKSWAEVLDSHSINSRSSAQFLILGPKNSGKSGLAKYLCNRLLKAGGRKVYFLELDPGQPEYTLPGCISLHRVTSYNFSPSYAHADFRFVVKCHHLGYTSPTDTPERYLGMCRDLLDTFASVAAKNDCLVVNAPGWTKGLGSDIITELCTNLDSNDVVPLHLGPSELGFEVIEVDKIEANSEAGNSTLTTSGFSSTELQSLQIMSYLHQNCSDHITSWAPFELKLGAPSPDLFGVAVIDSSGVNLAEDLSICIEGTLVAINVLSNTDNLTPGVLEETSSNDVWQRSHCIGMGVIQSVAEDLSSLRLLTPIDPLQSDLLDHEIVLIRGRLQLPIWALFNREIPDSPWIMHSKAVGTGASYTKFRRNIRRN